MGNQKLTLQGNFLYEEFVGLGAPLFDLLISNDDPT